MAELDRHTRSAFRKELQRAEEERARLDVVIGYLRDRLGEATPADATAAVQQQSPRRLLTETDENTGRKKLVRPTAANAAHQVLTKRGEPMLARDMIDEVRALGASAGDVETLSRALKRDRRFERVSRGLWKLAAWRDQAPPLDLGLDQPPPRSDGL